MPGCIRDVALLILTGLVAFSQPLGSGYVGSSACATCHREIATRQSQTNMALTWQGATAAGLPRIFDKKKSEGPVQYRLRRAVERWLWSVQLPGRPLLDLPVEVAVGGRRHGVSFLARVSEIEGKKLERAPLVEARFLQGAHASELMLSPGFPAGQPHSFETAIGHALSPTFERKCLACHGKPGDGGQNESGVRCESCHGPGQAHLTAAAAGSPRTGIVNPKKLTADQNLELCGRCHSGFGKKTDPLPEELLVSSQTVALRNTECFKQSPRGPICTTCHDPHRDATESESAAVTACLGCHSVKAAKHAALCPVNQTQGCIGCHMPRVTEGGFQMVDHWIRVHPERSAPKAQATPTWRSEIIPSSEFLRLIVVKEESRAIEIRRQLDLGAPFFGLAEQFSTDPSAPNGGYLGELKLADLKPELAAAAQHLQYGEISPVLSSSGEFFVLARMPRDFRFRAAQLQKEADALRAKGSLREAADKCRQALRIYPNFLRALFLLAAVEEQSGDMTQSARLLQSAAQLYPDDATAQFNLGVSYGSLGDVEQAARSYQRALALDPDHTAAYLNLGSALFSMDRAAEAIGILRDGLRVNPLSAPLYYSLGIAERKQGNAINAKKALALAEAIDLEFVHRQAK